MKTAANPTYLLPKPKICRPMPTKHAIPNNLFIYIERLSQAPCAKRLGHLLQTVGIQPQFTPSERKADWVFRIDPRSGLASQGYRLEVEKCAISLDAADDAGLAFGIQTLIQWIELHAWTRETRPTLQGLHLEDWPEFRHRGYMLDISRDKVPTMQTLFEIVDLLASLKINQLQLYTEHSFAYRGHEIVWRDASPMTPDEIRELDAYCRERWIELVPNQNSFGHFHRWLVHAPYRRLAECPEGVEHPFSLGKEPFSLCPLDPEVPRLLEDLYDQLLPLFSSQHFNVGLDETFDLGKGRSAGACERRGKGRVYLDFLKTVHELVGKHGKRMQFWGDIILNHPELMGALPKNVEALAWGYEADHPFEEIAGQFAASGLRFYVCPGTSAWHSIAGRTQNALLNLARAARAGKAYHAAGYLITDWGDYGHLQPLPVSYTGLAAGAAFAWNTDLADEPLTPDFAALLDLHFFRDKARVMGRSALDLGNAYLHPGFDTANGSPLFFLLRYPEEPMSHSRLRGLTIDGLEKTLAAIKEVKSRLAGARMACEDAAWLTREWTWAGDLLDWACRFGIDRLNPSGPNNRKAPAHELVDLIAVHEEIWLRRNRPGGLPDSRQKLARILQYLD